MNEYCVSVCVCVYLCVLVCVALYVQYGCLGNVSALVSLLPGSLQGGGGGGGEEEEVSTFLVKKKFFLPLLSKGFHFIIQYIFSSLIVRHLK